MSTTLRGNWRALISVVVLLGGLAPSAGVHADDVVDHLVRHGHMRRRNATNAVKKVSRKMTSNAERGGNDYDRVRQAVGMALFGASGAGGTLEEYNARLGQVLSKLQGGLDLWTLTALFGGESIANCRQDFGLSKADCRAFASAANVAPVIDVDGLLAEARNAFQAGNYSRAAEAYEQVTLSRPSEAAAFAGLGQSRIRIGDGRGAVQALRKAIELAPNVANLRAYLGRAYMATGDRAAAGTAFQEALSLNANHADARAGMRELESAPVRTNQVAAASPSPTAPRFGTPRFAASNASASQPTHSASSAGGFGGGRFGGGSANGRNAPNPVAMQWVQKGDAHLQARQFTQALSAYQMGASFDPSHAPAFAGIGAASMGAGDRAGAARALQTAVRLAPESADYHAALGNALAANGDNETATAAYRRALSIVPGQRAATAGPPQLEGGGAPAPTMVASVAPAPTAQPRFGAPRTSATAVSTVAVAPQAPAPRPAPAPMPVAEPEPEPVAAAEPEPTAEPEPVAEPEPAAPEPTVEEDDLIAGLLADPLGPSNARGRGGSRNAPAASGGGSSGGTRAPAPASGAPASGGGTGLPQTPSRDQVAEVMRGLLSTVKACVPDQTGTIAVQITITGASGEVADASVVGREADDPEAICVSEVVRGATFPRFAKDKLSIKFPFQL